MPGAVDPWDAARQRVARQAHYLRNPLAAAPGICYVCRGPAKADWSRCYPCQQHLKAAQAFVADVVVPISYAVKGRQHAHALAAYKSGFPTREIQTNLLNLLLIFLTDHHSCVAEAARVDRWTHTAVVPSTRGRMGDHPLRTLIGERLRFPWTQLAANAGISPDSRAFHPDRFTALEDLGGARVLLLDDTWTTGARIQSASFALKHAGANRVAAIVLGRHSNPAYDGRAPILDVIKNQPYRQETCPVHR